MEEGNSEEPKLTDNEKVSTRIQKHSEKLNAKRAMPNPEDVELFLSNHQLGEAFTLGRFIKAREEWIRQGRNKVKKVEGYPGLKDLLDTEVNKEERLLELQKRLKWIYLTDTKVRDNSDPRWQLRDRSDIIELNGRTLDDEERKVRFGSLEEILSLVPEFKTNVAGDTPDKDPFKIIESYARQVTGIDGAEFNISELSLKEAEDVMARLDMIREEAKKADIDIASIDFLLSEFLFARIQHFASTFRQRVKQHAQLIWSNQQEIVRAPLQPHDAIKMSVDQIESDLYNCGILPDINSVLDVAETIMEKKGLKAKLLAQLGVESACFGLGQELGNPFAPDRFKTPGFHQ